MIENPEHEMLCGMGRKRTQLSLTTAQCAELTWRVQSTTDARMRERLHFVLLAAEGRLTLEEIAARLGRARSTIQIWLDKFTAGGLAELLERESPAGLFSPLSNPTVLDELQAGLQAGRWTSAQHIADWLHETHGIRRARKSIYYWLKLKGWPAPGTTPPPLHSQTETTSRQPSRAAKARARDLPA